MERGGVVRAALRFTGVTVPRCARDHDIATDFGRRGDGHRNESPSASTRLSEGLSRDARVKSQVLYRLS